MRLRTRPAHRGYVAIVAATSAQAAYGARAYDHAAMTPPGVVPLAAQQAPRRRLKGTAFLIRAAVLGDMPALRDVFRRSSLSDDGDRATLLAHPDALELSDLAVREGRTRVAVADDRVVGFGTWLSTRGIFEIEDLFVDPERMGQGIGRALVLDLIAIARGHGVGRVEVTANQRALAFYERVGFVVEDEVTTRFGPAPRMGMDIAS